MKSQTGFTFIETLIGLSLLGIVAVGFLSGLATTFKAVEVSQERMISESLAKSQLEYIKVQDYVQAAVYNPDDPDKCYKLIDIPDDLVGKGYDIQINPPQTIISPYGEMFELQSVTVVIKHNGEIMLRISGYKGGRVA